MVSIYEDRAELRRCGGSVTIACLLQLYYVAVGREVV